MRKFECEMDNLLVIQPNPESKYYDDCQIRGKKNRQNTEVRKQYKRKCQFTANPKWKLCYGGIECFLR